MIKNKKYLFFISMLLVCPIAVHAGPSRWLAQIGFAVADYFKQTEYDDVIYGINDLLHDVSAQVRDVSMDFSPVHDRYLIDIEQDLLYIQNSWIPFAAEYDDEHGLAIADLRVLYDSLNLVSESLRFAFVTNRANYEFELLRMREVLDDIVYEMDRPLIVGDALYSIARWFDELYYVAERLR